MDSIDGFITGQLAAWEVPGCAVAAVRGGQAELTSGWGRRDREADLPVTAGTLFAIGSVTKAFTAATVGAMVDDGLLEWERPLRDYVPGIRLHDPVVADRLTIVDLLSHRSGLPRHDLTWMGHPGRSRSDIVSRLRFLPLSRDLRQEYQYCNLGYLVAGHVVDVLSGVPWEDFVRGRLLSPLGMDRSNLSVDDMLADADHAVGHGRRDGVIVPVPPRPFGAMGPAGGINSCATDMARWLLAQLADGQADGTAVLAPGAAARQRSPHVLVSSQDLPGLTEHAYGLGWAIGRYREHRLAMHAGGIDGFQSESMLLPDDDVGVAVLTNTSTSLMPLVVACRVLDELLEMEPLDLFSFLKPRVDAGRDGIRGARDARRIVAGAPLPRPLADYAGEYEHPGYGTLAITLDGDALKPRFGTMDLSLAHRHYETFDLEWHEAGDQPLLFPLMFLSDPDGDITGLSVPFEPSVEPLQFDRRPDPPDPEVLRRLCGRYAMGPFEVVVALHGEHGEHGERGQRGGKGGQRLTAAAPGSPPVELEPIRGLRFRVRGQPSRTAEFELDGSGTVTRLVAQPTGIFLPSAAR